MTGEKVGPDATRSAKFTYEDFVNFPNDGKRHEIIDGEHYVTPSPQTKHQVVSGNLHGRLWAFLNQSPLGRVFHAPFDVVLSDLDIADDAASVRLDGGARGDLQVLTTGSSVGFCRRVRGVTAHGSQ